MKDPLWLEFVSVGLCGLCGNTGSIDTRSSAVSAAGVRCGVRAFCICPNGRALKRSSQRVQSGKEPQS